MGLRTGGRRKIEVHGRVYYWDFRAEGSKPGLITPDDMYLLHKPAIVRIVSEDKQFHATYDGIRVTSGDHKRELRPHHVFPITPRIVRRIIEEALRLGTQEVDPRIKPNRWWIDL